MRKIEEGTVLIQDTCDEIVFTINGEFKRINPHIEHWIVVDIKSNSYNLYNLDTGRDWKIEKRIFENMLLGNKRLGIEPVLIITDIKA